MPFPPTSSLFLLACIFLIKLLAASALWAAAWHGQKRGTSPARGPDCGHDPGYQLQTLTGELGESTVWLGVDGAERARWGREGQREYSVCCRAERHLRGEDPTWDKKP